MYAIKNEKCTPIRNSCESTRCKFVNTVYVTVDINFMDIVKMRCPIFMYAPNSEESAPTSEIVLLLSTKPGHLEACSQQIKRF